MRVSSNLGKGRVKLLTNYEIYSYICNIYCTIYDSLKYEVDFHRKLARTIENMKS